MPRIAHTMSRTLLPKKLNYLTGKDPTARYNPIFFFTSVSTFWQNTSLRVRCKALSYSRRASLNIWTVAPSRLHTGMKTKTASLEHAFAELYTKIVITITCTIINHGLEASYKARACQRLSLFGEWFEIPFFPSLHSFFSFSTSLALDLNEWTNESDLTQLRIHEMTTFVQLPFWWQGSSLVPSHTVLSPYLSHRVGRKNISLTRSLPFWPPDLDDGVSVHLHITTSWRAVLLGLSKSVVVDDQFCSAHFRVP